MLGDRDAGGSAKNGDGGGNVERAQAVATGADDVEDFAGAGFGGERWRNGFFAQRGGERGDFHRRLAFQRERDQKFRFGRRRNFFIGQIFDGADHLRHRQRLAGGELASECFQHGAILRGGAKGTN